MNVVLPLYTALGLWFMHWAGCTDGKYCMSVGFLTPVGLLLLWFPLATALNVSYVEDRAVFLFKVAELASRQSGTLAEAKLLFDDLLALCQDYGMVEHELDARVAMAALEGHAGHAAEADRHESAAHELLNRHRRGWRWLAHMFVKIGARWGLVGMMLGDSNDWKLDSLDLTVKNTNDCCDSTLFDGDVRLGRASFDALTKARLHAALGRMDAALRELRRMCNFGGHCNLDSICTQEHAQYSELKDALERNERWSKPAQWCRRLARWVIPLGMSVSVLGGILQLAADYDRSTGKDGKHPWG